MIELGVPCSNYIIEFYISLLISLTIGVDLCTVRDKLAVTFILSESDFQFLAIFFEKQEKKKKKKQNVKRLTLSLLCSMLPYLPKLSDRNASWNSIPPVFANSFIQQPKQEENNMVGKRNLKLYS